MGACVKHRSRARFNPMLPNLRQVHLIDTGFIALLAARGFAIGPGDIGENILIDGLDLITMPTGTRLMLGDGGGVITLTGLRNPCIQMDRFMPGLMAASLDRDAYGGLIRRSGVMAMVDIGGDVRPGDRIAIALPAGDPVPLKPV